MFNINPIFKDMKLFFDEPSHKYTDNFGNEYKSATTLLHDYKPEFKRDYWLTKKAKELGISKARLEKQWEDIKNEACTRGTNTHNGLEDGIKNNSLFYNAVKHTRKKNDTSMITVADLDDINSYIKPLDIKDFKESTDNKYPQIYDVFEYYIDRDYKIYSEIGVFLPQVLVSGTIDVLIVREDKMIVGDWKTNRGGLKFTSGYYKKDKTEKPFQETDVWVEKKDFLLPPVSHLPECNGSIYNLQLSLYAFMVEWILGIPNVGLWLCHIDSDFVLNKYGMPKRFNDGFHLRTNPKEITTFYKMKYLKQEIYNILEDRRRIVDASRVRSKDLFS